MPIEDFFYNNLNQHFLPDNAETSSSDGKYENMNAREMVEILASKKILPIKCAELEYIATHGNLTAAKEFLVIRRNAPIPTNKADTEEKRFLVNNQLKFHVSLPEDKYAEGWNIIMPILIEEGAALFKIPHKGKQMSSQEGQYGKDITIYADKNPDKGITEWHEILTAITEALVAADISPGYKTARTETESERFDRGITGSKYISYRYDAKNPPSVNEDLCTKLSINVHQPYEPQIFGQNNADQTAQDLGQNNNADESCCKKCNII